MAGSTIKIDYKLKIDGVRIIVWYELGPHGGATKVAAEVEAQPAVIAEPATLDACREFLALATEQLGNDAVRNMALQVCRPPEEPEIKSPD